MENKQFAQLLEVLNSINETLHVILGKITKIDVATLSPDIPQPLNRFLMPSGGDFIATVVGAKEMNNDVVTLNGNKK